MLKSEVVMFRASPEFVAMLAEKAAAEKINKSEAIRRAMAELAQSEAGHASGAMA